jgi:hypothetical protein
LAEPDGVAPWNVCCAQLADLGALGLCQLERSFSHLIGILGVVRRGGCRLLGDGGVGGEELHPGEVSTDKVVFADLWKFGVSYWLIVALCIVFYSAIFPFQTFAVKFFMEAHGTSREFGGFLSSMLTLFAMIATPLFGLWVDRVGKRALLMMLGSLLLIPVYLMMAYTHINLYIPMAMMGVAFSLIPAVMWPSVAYIVDQAKLGTAYGLMTMIQNIGLFGLESVGGMGE